MKAYLSLRFESENQLPANHKQSPHVLWTDLPQMPSVSPNAFVQPSQG